jgi:hypothetical protein
VAAAGLTATVAGPAAAVPLTKPEAQAVIGGCIRGTTPYQYQNVHVVWKSSTGRVKGDFTVESQEYGYWSPPDGLCPAHSAQPGDTIKSTAAAITNVAPQSTATFTVPNLTVNFDRKTNVVSGTASTLGKQLYVTIIRYDLDGTGPTEDFYKPITINSSGQYSWNTFHANTAGDYDARGADYAYVDWSNANGDRAQRVGRAAFLQATIGSSNVVGFATPGSTVSLSYQRPSGLMPATGQDTAGELGLFGVTLKDGAAKPVNVVGNRDISGNWVPSAIFKTMAMNTAIDGNQVTGTCNPLAHYGIRVTWTSSYAYEHGTTDELGKTGPLDLTKVHTLGPGDVIVFICERTSGDRTRQVTVVP